MKSWGKNIPHREKIKYKERKNKELDSNYRGETN